MSPERPRPRTHRVRRPDDGSIDACPHAGLRLRIEVTPDLAFEYCPECELRGWWSRGSGAVLDVRSELRRHRP